jgi:hypothetical protein
MQIRTIDQFNEFINLTRTLPTGIDKPTPYLLVDKMIKLPDLDWKDPNLRILDPAFGFGTFLFACYLKLIPYHSEEHILNNMLYGVEIDSFRYRMTKHNLGIKNLFLADFLSWETDMKFDNIIINPPYQMVTNGNSNAIWHKFILKSFGLLKEGGNLVAVHPSGWRSPTSKFDGVKEQLLNKTLTYLEIHDMKDGQKTFGVSTRFDMYHVLNEPSSENHKTQVVFEDGSVARVDLKKLPFIPNHSLENIVSLLAESGEEAVEVLYSRSAYGADKKHINTTQTEVYKYPVIYHVNKDGSLSFKWSTTNQNGHFGQSKLVWIPNAQGTGYYIDIEGNYGLTNFATAIVDTPGNLVQIKNIIEHNEEFRKLITATFIIYGGITYKILSLFRKDFWKEFA